MYLKMKTIVILATRDLWYLLCVSLCVCVFWNAKEEEEMLVKTLLTFGADVNPLNQVSQTPLDIAIDKQSSNVVAILVSVGGTTGDKVLEENERPAAAQNMLEPFDTVCT